MMRWMAAVSAALISVVLSVAPAAAADKVVLMLNWYVYGEHAPFYYGKAKGIYAAENIDLEIQEGRGSAATTQAVAAKTADFGYVDVPTMMRAAVKGAPVIATGVLLQTSPMSAMGFVEKNIRKPEDIKGKTVAITPADSMTQIWPLFLKKTGLKESDFQTVAGDGQTKLNAVINGQADLLLGYVMDQSMKIKDATGKDVYPIKFADYGINMVSSGIIANTDYVKANADLVKRFMTATTKAVEAAEKDPKGAAQSERRQDRHADARIQADDPALPHGGDQGQAAVPGDRSEHERHRQSDGRIWRPRRQGQGKPEIVLHQRVSAQIRLSKSD